MAINSAAEFCIIFRRKLPAGER